MSENDLGAAPKPFEYSRIRSFEILKICRTLLSTLKQISKLPIANLHFEMNINPDDIQKTYKYFTKPHPLYKVFRNKGLGAELITLNTYPTRDSFLDAMKMKNRAGRYAKRALARGYRVLEIDRNNFVDDIHAINTSIEIRQKRPMDQGYLKKIEQFEAKRNFRYFGVLNKEGKLFAYCNVGFYGNFYSLDRIIGHRNNDGVMHLLVIEMVCRLIDAGNAKYLMYDTYFGASPNMKMFKSMFGFEPFRVKFSIQ